MEAWETYLLNTMAAILSREAPRWAAQATRARAQEARGEEEEVLGRGDAGGRRGELAAVAAQDGGEDALPEEIAHIHGMSTSLLAFCEESCHGLPPEATQR